MKTEKTPLVVKQFVITPAAGKRLIAKGIAEHPSVTAALKSGTIVIIAGTTNGYVAEEILKAAGVHEEFPRGRFIRGITLPPAAATTDTGRLPDESAFPGDVVLSKGAWRKGKTIYDVVDDLKEGDVILKGANALDPVRRRAAIQIGHPKAGTVGAALQAVLGRRVELILPVGLEKRVFEDLDELAVLLNTPGAKGPRLLPVPGRVFTEIDAVRLLSSAEAQVVSAGGVGGAEGGIWLAVSGAPENVEKAEKLLSSVSREPRFEL